MAPPPKLTEEEIDDLIYLARVNELSEFTTELATLCEREKCDIASLVRLAKDAESGNGVLHMAAANGHVDILSHLLTRIENDDARFGLLSAQNSAGNTPLHWAALNGHLAAVQCLVERGADPYLQNKAGHDAVYEAERNDRREAVEWMLKEGGLEEEMDGVEGAADEEAQEGGEGEKDLKQQLEDLDLKGEKEVEVEVEVEGKGKGRAE